MSSLGTYLEYIGYDKRKTVPHGHWKNKENHKNFMNWLRKKEGYNTMEDLYKLSANDFKRNRGSSLLAKYNWSPIKVLSSVYPDYEWFWWKFKMSPTSNNWSDITKITEYMDWLGKKLGYNTMEDWYKISSDDFSNNYGQQLVNIYGRIIKILKAAYSNYPWLPWRGNGWCNWKDPEIQKWYIKWLGEVLGYTTMEDWYKISGSDFKNNYGFTLCNHLDRYMSEEGIYGLIKNAYPDYPWLPWKFNRMTKGLWKKPEIQKWYIKWLGEVLGYTTMEDWYKISRRDFSQNYGGGLLSINHSYISILTKVYPEYNWNKSEFVINKTENIIHKFLLNNISNLQITNKELYQYKPDWCKNLDTNKCLPYDFYIELPNEKKIIIECDGEQHYTEIPHYHRNDKTFEKLQDRDIFKMNKALENGISIIRVHQIEVYNDTIDWKKELTDAINEIKNENEVTIKLLGCLKDKVPWEFE